jgi:hypothetical protein
MFPQVSCSLSPLLLSITWKRELGNGEDKAETFLDQLLVVIMYT